MIRHRLRAIRIGEPCIVAGTRGPTWYLACASQALHGWGPVGRPVRRLLGCRLLRRHHWVRVIDRATFEDAALFGGVGARVRILASHRECCLCHVERRAS